MKTPKTEALDSYSLLMADLFQLYQWTNDTNEEIRLCVDMINRVKQLKGE